MSSSSFDATIDLRLKPSLRALQILFALHVGVAGLLLFALSPGLPMALLGAGVAASWFWLRRHPAFGYGPRALAQLTWQADGEWLLARPGGTPFKAQLQGSSYLHPRLVVLNFRDEQGKRWSRALLGDEAGPELLRRLRARLAIAGQPAG